MKKWYMMLAVYLMLGIVPMAEAALPETRVETEKATREAAQFFEKAYIAYSEGKSAIQAGERSERYAEAISAISRAAILQPDNPDILILASQIYRSKGGTAYAKDYFARAESILIAQISATPKDIGAQLDYAIACYAGDARFKDNYDSYRNIAYQHATEVVQLVGQSNEKNATNLRMAAFAYLVKGDAKRCGELLSQSAQTDAVSKFYSELFETTVGRKQWLWPVSADTVEKEFLLYVMTDSSRYSGFENTSNSNFREGKRRRE